MKDHTKLKGRSLQGMTGASLVTDVSHTAEAKGHIDTAACKTMCWKGGR